MRKVTVSGGSGKQSRMSARQQQMHEIDLEKYYQAMEKGHKVWRLLFGKKLDMTPKHVSLNGETRQICLRREETSGSAGVASASFRLPPMTLDLRYVREVHTLDYKLKTVAIGDKWTRDRDLRSVEPSHVLTIAHGHSFNLNYCIFIFETPEAARMWCLGLQQLVADTLAAPHTVVVDRWLKKQFNTLITPTNNRITMKHMKPYAQTTLQCKVSTRFLQDQIREQMNFDEFSAATRILIESTSIFSLFFSKLSDDGQTVTFSNFLRFLKDMQSDDMADHSERAADFLRRFLNEGESRSHRSSNSRPTLTISQFSDFLFSRENSLWDPMNDKVLHDMNRPLSHYWIASSHNTYLTGDQLRSESSLDSYSRALLMGCRCIELDCWDGARRSGTQEILDIVIYHGYTMTSKLQLRDVLQTIRHYAFVNSEFPVILSIEDNCSVPAQRLLAADIREILGEYLLTQPVSREETELPSPAALKRKIIIKHKKLPIESEELAIPVNDDFQDTDLLSKECVKRGILHLRNNITNEWTPHVFVLFPDRLCYVTEECNEDGASIKAEDSVSVCGDDESLEESLSGFGVRPEEMHVTEEWFHGKADRQSAMARLLEQKDNGNGVFLVRDSTIFIGDYSLSFLHDEQVYHCRIKTKMVDGEKKYYFLENVLKDTLYELICHYMKKPLTTPNFSTSLVTSCPQPQPYLTQPWFSATATKESAEELLRKVPEDGAFLVRYSSSDKNVFVISIRVDDEFWHYRLKKNGRIFVVNQTVFESLNQIVDFYSNRDFVRGISLKYPVNEVDVEKFAYAYPSLDAAAGCYMDINTVNQEVQARSLLPFTASGEDDLSFPVNVVITVIRKEKQLWRGKYDGKVGWFPPTYVQEIVKGDGKENSPSYVTIELAGVVIERLGQGEVDRPFAFRISHANAHWSGQTAIVAASSVEEADDWQNQTNDLLRSVNDKISTLRSREKNLRIASELSNLVVYCQAVPFNPAKVGEGSFYEMCSFSESKLEKLLEKGLVMFNCRQLSRVYPQGSRITSANFSPVPMWNAGCHMVALNYQTGDRAMQLNQGKFLANGRCGYVLKPSYMLDSSFDPTQGNRVLAALAPFRKVTSSCPVELQVTVLAGRHLSRKDKNKGICSPFVAVEVIGLPCDDRTVKTSTITSNGLNPYWNEVFTFNVQCPEVALLRFLAEDGDFVGPKTDPFIGQAVFPLDCIRTGYRSVPLRNQFAEELEMSSLLVHVQIMSGTSEQHGCPFRSAHSALQANRSVYAGGRSLSLPSPPLRPSSAVRVYSLDVPPGIPAPAPLSGRPRNHSNVEENGGGSTDSTTSDRKRSARFRKLFSFGRKPSQ